MKSNPYHTQYTNYFRWAKGLNVKSRTSKLLEDNRISVFMILLLFSSVERICLDEEGQSINEKMEKLDYTKM